MWSTANQYGQASKLDVEHVAHIRQQYNIDEASHEADRPGVSGSVPHASVPSASAVTLSRPQIIPRRKVFGVSLLQNLPQFGDPVKEPADMATEQLPFKGVGSEEDEGDSDRCKSAAGKMEAPGSSAIEDFTTIQPQFRVPGLRRRGIRPPMIEKIRNN